MEKSRGRRRSMVKTHLCIPRLVRGGSSSSSSSRSSASASAAAATTRLSPAMSLLERLREAVFRLIMLTALSKATTSQGGSRDLPRSYHRNEPHHSEAVADCIEFIKKSASPDDSRGATASCGSLDSARAVPVM